MAPKRSIYRAPDAQHFQLVHRSQRDPLIHDAEASQRVLKLVKRTGNAKGDTLADLEAQVAASGSSIRPNEGEASAYGVYYDDSSYDYMQHLRPVGQAGNEAVFVAAPKTKGTASASAQPLAGGGNGKGKGRGYEPDKMFRERQVLKLELPEHAMASEWEYSREEVLEQQAAVPRELQGLQPDMNPHLRQVLEALEDDAFVVNAKSIKGAKQQQQHQSFEGKGKGKGKEQQLEEEEEEDEGDYDEEGDDDDFFDELLGDGEGDEEDLEEFEFSEWGVDDRYPNRQGQGRGQGEDPVAEQVGQEVVGSTIGEEDLQLPKEETWQDRFKSFKQSQSQSQQKSTTSEDGDGDDYADTETGQGADGRSEMADTIGSLPAMSVIGGKKRRKGAASDASGYSMSSSSMFRNKGLSTLDEMFDKVERDYENEDGEFDDDDFPEDDDGDLNDSSSFISSSSTRSSSSSLFPRRPKKDGSTPNDIPEISREDFDAILDDFLDNYEIVGSKMVPKLEGSTGAEKLERVRRELLQDENDDEKASLAGGRNVDKDYIRKRFLRERSEEEEGEEELKELMPVRHKVGGGKGGKDKWDVETILSTYFNTENHPRVISSRTKPKKIVEPASPPPSVAPPALAPIAADSDSDDSGSETEMEDSTKTKVTIARVKGESKEEKKARKASVKAERANRRQEKKAKQELFSGERKKQVMKHNKQVGNGNAADLSVANKDRGGVVLLV